MDHTTCGEDHRARNQTPQRLAPGHAVTEVPSSAWKLGPCPSRCLLLPLSGGLPCCPHPEHLRASGQPIGQAYPRHYCSLPPSPRPLSCRAGEGALLSQSVLLSPRSDRVPATGFPVRPGRWGRGRWAVTGSGPTRTRNGDVAG